GAQGRDVPGAGSPFGRRSARTARGVRLRSWVMGRATASGVHRSRRGQLVVASNRLPVVMRRRDGGGFDAEPASGGLVSALAPVLERSGGAWVGWPGVTDVGEPELSAALRSMAQGHELAPVPL